jgi:hypothetical protein
MLHEQDWIDHSIGARGGGYSFDRDAVKRVIDESIYERTAKLVVDWNKNLRSKVYIRGTTFSGSAVRTTLGNTLRVILYWDFVCYNLDIAHNMFGERDKQSDIFIFVSGDDSCMWCSPETA